MSIGNDRVNATEKTQAEGGRREDSEDCEDRAGEQRAANMQVTSLEIEQDCDAGGDPYNRTGQHCIIRLNEYE